jgi:tripartite ATP-independent transporter DctP family solute receptor
MVYAIPYLFDDQVMAWTVVDGPFGKEMAEDMTKKTGIRLFGLADNGIRHFTNSKRAIKSPDDMKGLKMRVMTGPIWTKLVEPLGASPSPVPWTELPAALQQGVVDGQENPLMNIHASKLYEVQKNLALTNHQFQITPFLMSKRSWDRLSDADKKALQEAAVEATTLQRKLSQEADDKLMADLKSKGVQVTTVDKAAFAKATAPVTDKWLAGPIGPYVKKVVNAAHAN